MLKLKPKYLVQNIYSKVTNISQSSLTFRQYRLLRLGLKTTNTDLAGLNLISFSAKSKHTSNIRCRPIALGGRRPNLKAVLEWSETGLTREVF